MDQPSLDRKYLSEKRCPDCHEPIKKYFLRSDRPMCEKCDTWYLVQDNGWVVRNSNANKLYNDIMEKLKTSTEVDIETFTF